MESALYLIPIALFLGLLGLAAFIWSLKSGQFEDLDGAAQRVLFDDEDLEQDFQKAADIPVKDHGAPVSKK